MASALPRLTARATPSAVSVMMAGFDEVHVVLGVTSNPLLHMVYMVAVHTDTAPLGAHTAPTFVYPQFGVAGLSVHRAVARAPSKALSARKCRRGLIKGSVPTRLSANQSEKLLEAQL